MNIERGAMNEQGKPSTINEPDATMGQEVVAAATAVEKGIWRRT